MWHKWFPWKFIVRHVARAHGFLDPASILSQLQRFAQPSEVAEPIELLRAGLVFHARGLMNTRAIQHNLDWVWPYWVQRQFDPRDPSFIPRAFSITHVNLTHRNWTAIGLPDLEAMPIVDPRGLVTPFLDSWSLDSWIVAENGKSLIPSRLCSVSQYLCMERGLAVVTEASGKGFYLKTQVEVVLESHQPVCVMRLNGCADSRAWFVISLRPYNPEGVSFVHDVVLEPDRKAWIVHGSRRVKFSTPFERHRLSNYRSGDVFLNLPVPGKECSVKCDVGMATAAVMYELQKGHSREVAVRIPLHDELPSQTVYSLKSETQAWENCLQGHCELQIPDERFQYLYDSALRSLILHSPGVVYPGPYTYKRFWFRDAAFILHAMLCAGLLDRVERALNDFPRRQTRLGYFRSQEGEWDSNGEALWIMHRFCELKGCLPKREWRQSIYRGGKWIKNKRLSEKITEPHAGLLPAGFSAEHLGPNDYYYWDNFWSIAGLRGAAKLLYLTEERHVSVEFQEEADALMTKVEQSLKETASQLFHAGMPASPYRRMDAGSVGSLAAGYPLQLWPPRDQRLLETANFLRKHCFLGGSFFQDMIHSGINPYLTLHIAQIFLRGEDPGFFEIVNDVAQRASPTGQWPEAIHPQTGGGCMGDGQHVWASAEWILMMRNCFVREEEDHLVLASGIPEVWLDQKKDLYLGPTPTRFGTVSVLISPDPMEVLVSWQGNWRGKEPVIKIHLPGFQEMAAPIGETELKVRRKGLG